MDLFTPAPLKTPHLSCFGQVPPLGLLTPAALVLGCGSPGLVSGSLTRQGTLEGGAGLRLLWVFWQKIHKESKEILQMQNQLFFLSSF